MNWTLSNIFRAFFLGLLMQILSTVAWSADIAIHGSVNVSGNMSAGFFTGDGSGLTNIPGASIANTSVTTNQIADKTITAGKVAFFDRMAIVSQNGGNYTDPATAMADYATWCPNPDKYNPCLLKIMPGMYFVTTPIQMVDSISIEGSGKADTYIFGSINSTSSGLLIGAGGEVRNLHLKNFTNDAANVIAIYNTTQSGPGLTISNAIIEASGGVGGNATGIYNRGSINIIDSHVEAWSGLNPIGLNNSIYSPEIKNSKIYAHDGAVSNTGVVNDSTYLFIKKSEVIALGSTGVTGVVIKGNSTVSLFDTNVHGDTSGIAVKDTSSVFVKNAIIGENTPISIESGARARVANTEIHGAISNSGSLTCVGAYNADYVALSTSCN